MVIVQHVTDDLLERFAMQTLPESETGPLEDHLMICSEVTFCLTLQNLTQLTPVLT